MQSTNVKTTITGLSVTTPTASNSTHFHIKIKDNTNPIGVFVKANSKTINTSGVGGSSSTLTQQDMVLKLVIKLLIQQVVHNLTG